MLREEDGSDEDDGNDNESAASNASTGVRSYEGGNDNVDGVYMHSGPIVGTRSGMAKKDDATRGSKNTTIN